MAGGGTQQSMRKYLGAIKDSTTVNLAKVNSEYKDLDIAIVKATNHVEHPAKEKHVQAIFAATSAARPRADVAYCIHALARRLAKTHNWVVALKTLIVIHRALREVDPTFCEELINYGRNRSHMLNLSHFKDDSSPEAWEYSAWVRTYALYLEEKLECFRVVKYDVEIEPSKTRDLDTVELLEHLPALQELLFRLLGCQPQGAAAYNMIIQSAVSMVVDESIKLYTAINNGILNLVDKFFDMQHHHAIKAIDIYKRAGKQAEKLSELYEMCKSIGFRRGEGFIKVDQPLASFVTVMEEYAKDAPMAPTMRKDELPKVPNHRIEAPKTVLPIEYKESPKVQEEPNPPAPPPPPPEPEKVEKTPVPEEPADLLGLKSETNPHAAELDNQNAMALAIVPVDNSSATTSTYSHVAGEGWELALVTAPSSNESAATTSTMAGGFDKLTLDSLYDDATRRANQSTSYNPWEMPTMGSHNMMQPVTHDPFYGSHRVAAPPNVQMETIAQQQQAFMMQQQQMQQPAVVYQHPRASTNPFGDPNDSTGFQQSSNTHGSLI